MRNYKLLLGVLGLIMSLSAPARADDAERGYQLAKDFCARCHNIETGVTEKLRPHSFQAIANYYETDDVRARIFASSLHLGMPDIAWALTWNDIDDLTAYIMSLETPVSLPAK